MNFKGHISNKTDVGRWLVMEKADLNNDQKLDLMLGSCISTVRSKNPKKQKYWDDKKVAYLMLKSKYQH